MEIQQAIDTIKNLKEFYDNYSQAFDVAIKQLEGTLATRLGELDTAKETIYTLESQVFTLTGENNALKRGADVIT